MGDRWWRVFVMIGEMVDRVSHLDHRYILDLSDPYRYELRWNLFDAYGAMMSDDMHESIRTQDYAL